ncbi:TetR family transcriptional regulator [Mycolicibacterium celeriflavum]|uniref:TetR/AcrR family transcriptional regulator n=1 Tax=Mycolicibacterium celeriflavum TaxID=1249101 RepID=UPI0007FC40D6|nr:TetR/AcrR family transcriptional regulator [Mycolicibacterium celeriflavum]OBG12976.1 TetR family transcriptional regulator [Mycolicibacterium celeriflavum]
MPTTKPDGRSSNRAASGRAAASGKGKTAEPGARQRLIEATAELMRDEGYAAATSRRVAAEAGVKQALVYYYFPTMDNLFVEVLRAGAEVSLENMRAALTDDDPLRTLWLINSDLRATALNTEFMALANHRKVIRAELKAYAERVRDIETAAVTVALRARGIDIDEYPPVAISMLIAQIARSLCNESAVDVTLGHDEMRAFMERQFDLLPDSSTATAPPGAPG